VKARALEIAHDAVVHGEGVVVEAVRHQPVDRDLGCPLGHDDNLAVGLHRHRLRRAARREATPSAGSERDIG
jgi:hypothetical protein